MKLRKYPVGVVRVATELGTEYVWCAILSCGIPLCINHSI